MRRSPILMAVLLCFCGAALGQSNGKGTTAANNGEEGKPAYLNTDLALEQRVRDLTARMTLEEKVSQMQYDAPAIPRLGVPAYNWWSEALHGVARAGTATVFPQAIGLAATWDAELMHGVADVISTEARAKYNDAVQHGNRGQNFGLTFWSPNINIFRDPRWGRGQETYGEDPFLTGRMAVAFVTGMQGDNARYLKVVATAKHYAVHSGPEVLRHQFDVKVTQHDYEDTYTPAFRAAVVEGKADSIMCAYNAVRGDPACASPLLYGTLRNNWGFGGYAVSDCGAIQDIMFGHAYVAIFEQAVALAVKAGTDLTCGSEYTVLPEAVRDRLISVEDIDRAVERLFTARFRLGMFDPPAMVPWSKLTLADNDTAKNRQVALQAARESIVLLKNDRQTLPLKPNVRTIAVVGPSANSLDVLLGNYNGTPSRYVTILDGIRKRFAQAKILSAAGSTYTETEAGQKSAADLQVEAVGIARQADAVIAVVGITPELENEDADVNAPGFFGGDRVDLKMPEPQEELLQALAATGKPLIVVLTSGSALAVNWAQGHASAILEAWYPGEEGGTAVADVLAGGYSPSGRLPVTFYTSTAQLPAFTDYGMSKRTYRYFSGTPLYPFGFGLSYASFAYSGARVDQPQVDASQPVTISVEVQNTGGVAADEVVQCYVTHTGLAGAAIRSLVGFTRVHLERGEKKTVSLTLHERELSVVDEAGVRRIVPGPVGLWIGGGQPVAGVGQSPPPGDRVRLEITGAAILPE